MPNNQKITIDFSAKVVTNFGEEVFISGNLNQLGAWNTANALKLYTNKDIYPQWKNLSSITIQEKTTLQFKIFIKNTQGGIRWEKIHGNRKFLPTESVLINLQQSNCHMIYQPTISQQQIAAISTPPNRKKTFDIIRDLSDEVSQSSSGNQRQFWMQIRRRQRNTINSSKQFVLDAKLIFQTWTHQKGKIKEKIINQWTHLVTAKHIIIKKQGIQMHKGYHDQKPLKNQSSKSSIAFIGDTNIQYQISTQFNRNTTPTLKIFHIEDIDVQWALDIFKEIKKKFEGYWIIYLLKPDKLVDEYLLQNVQKLVTNNKTNLKDIIQKFHIRKNHSITMLKQNQFLIKKQNNKFVLVLYQPKITALDLQLTQNIDFFGVVQKNLLNPKYFPLPQNLKISLIIHRNMVHQVHKHRFCLAILCQKLQDIPKKIITNLIRISSYRNISVNIMTGDQISQIFRKLPVSDNDKLLVYNRNGQVFKPGKKSASIYDETKISHKKYQEIFNHLKNKAKFWIQNRQVQVIQNPHSLQFICEKNALGLAISQSLSHQFSKSQDFHYPYQIEKYTREDQKLIVVHIRPVLSSTQFYSRIITSINMFPPQNTFFFSFDYTNDKYKFIEKMGRAATEKRAISEGFIIANPQKDGGLKPDKFQQFLSFLINQACYSIIGQDLEGAAKSGGKKDKDAIRSDLIN